MIWTWRILRRRAGRPSSDGLFQENRGEEDGDSDLQDVGGDATGEGGFCAEEMYLCVFEKWRQQPCVEEATGLKRTDENIVHQINGDMAGATD